jgi:hypothetical protein
MTELNGSRDHYYNLHSKYFAPMRVDPLKPTGMHELSRTIMSDIRRTL